MPRLFSAKVLTLILIALLLDMSVFPWIFPGFFRPVLSYLLIPYVAFEWHWNRTIPVALLIGFARDLVSVQFFGIETVSLFCAALGLNFFVQKISINAFSVKMLGSFFFVFFAVFFNFTIHACLNFDIHFFHSFLVSFITALATTLLIPFFFVFGRHWFQEDFRASARSL